MNAMLTRQDNYIDTPALKELAAAGAVTRLTVKGVHGGFHLLVRVGLDERVLRTQRGGARMFKTLDSLVPYIRSLGLSRFDVDVEHWSMGGLFRQ